MSVSGVVCICTMQEGDEEGKVHVTGSVKDWSVGKLTQVNAGHTEAFNRKTLLPNRKAGDKKWGVRSYTNSALLVVSCVFLIIDMSVC